MSTFSISYYKRKKQFKLNTHSSEGIVLLPSQSKMWILTELAKRIQLRKELQDCLELN